MVSPRAPVRAPSSVCLPPRSALRLHTVAARSRTPRSEFLRSDRGGSDTRVTLLRTDQALETNPGVIAMSCPFCMMMIGDGIKAKDLEDKVLALDVMEMIERNLA